MELAKELTKILNQGEMNDRVQVRDYISNKAQKIQEQYYPDMKPKFSVDYSEIKLESAREFIEGGERLNQFDKTPIMCIVKTISGMSKNFILRMNHDMAEEGMRFNIEALKVTHGVDSGQLLAIVNEKHELCKVRMAVLNYRGDTVFDSKKRPTKHANEALEMVEAILKDDESANQHRAKAIALVAKTELAQNNKGRGEMQMSKA